MSRLAEIAEKTRTFGSWIETLRNIWGLTAVLGIIAFFLGRLAIAQYGLWPTLAGFGLLVVVAGAGFGLGWYAAARRMVMADYSWELADYTYQFDPSDVLHHVQTSKITIRASRHNVQLFRNRYWWTGVGRSDLSVVSPQHKLLTEVVRDAWRYYYVLLEQALSKGGSTTVVVRHDLYDTERMFQPMITKDVSESVAGLTLRIVFPPPLRPTKVLAAELSRSKAREVYWQIAKEQEIEVDRATGEVVYTVDHPKLGRRYRLMWTWTGYPSAS
jgi:hypothetical protein